MRLMIAVLAMLLLANCAHLTKKQRECMTDTECMEAYGCDAMEGECG